jgi:hypothetical protein
MTIWKPYAGLPLGEAVALKAGTDLYHYAESGPLEENRDEYIFLTKDLVKF